MGLPTVRVAKDKRGFVSAAIDEVIAEVSAGIADAELAWMFGNCFPNTLDTTVRVGRDAEGAADSYVITGDIDAMWLRDSTAQVWPYLPYLVRDEKLREMVEGLIRRQGACVRMDPYANAFYADAKRESEHKGDRTEMLPGVHERKYELDSLCSVMRLSAGYFAATGGDLRPFDAGWVAAIEKIVATIRTEQAGTEEGESPYRFERANTRSIETMPRDGWTHPTRRCGLSRSPFRPSDDATTLPLPVPGNALAVVTLRGVSPILRELGREDLATAAEKMAGEIDAGIHGYGVVSHPRHGEMYAFEVDGFGSHVLMDDANVPSLLSLAYFGYCRREDALYQRTRGFVLSGDNPYYAAGKAGRGIGGPHVGAGWIWPMGIILQGLTSVDDAEIAGCLAMLKKTHAGTGFMHEAFWKDDASKFTRSWFAWANTLFGELVLTVWKERRHLLK